MEKQSSRPIWTGAISFGLVTIPVKLYTAVREKRLHFRSLHDQDKVPLKQKLICPADGKEVHPEHIVKGFEIEKDRYVVDRVEADLMLGFYFPGAAVPPPAPAATPSSATVTPPS